jgi:iron complex outermembrane receptor protein
VGLDFLPEQHQRGYSTLDASLTLTEAGDRYSISAFGHNLTDETVMATTFNVPFSTFRVASLRPPRTLGVRVGRRF